MSGCSLRWQLDEETLLAECWVVVFEDQNVGAGQTKDTFWYRILNEFNDKNFQKRNKDMLTSKWHRLNHSFQKFNAVYKRTARLGKSGENEMDVLKWAKATYQDEKKSILFVQDDAWEVLRSHSKWDAPEPVDLTEDDVPGVGNKDLFGEDVRPRLPGPGKSKRPAKKSKSDTTTSTGGSNSSNPFGEQMSTEIHLKREAFEKAYESSKERDRTLTRLEEMKFLASFTKDLSEDDAYWIN
nr:glutathione S-transferase T3-like [Tanacetum cinerariifolium]